MQGLTSWYCSSRLPTFFKPHLGSRKSSRSQGLPAWFLLWLPGLEGGSTLGHLLRIEFLTPWAGWAAVIKAQGAVAEDWCWAWEEEQSGRMGWEGGQDDGETRARMHTLTFNPTQHLTGHSLQSHGREKWGVVQKQVWEVAVPEKVQVYLRRAYLTAQRQRGNCRLAGQAL